MNKKDIIRLVIGTVLLYWGLNHLEYFISVASVVIGIVSPFLLGCGIAFLLNLIMRPMEKGLIFLFHRSHLKQRHVQKMQRPLSIVLTIILLLSVFAGLLAVVVPKLSDTILSIHIQQDVKEFLLSLQGAANSQGMSNLLAWIETLGVDFTNVSKDIMDTLGGMGGKIISSSLNVVTTVFSKAATFGIAFVFAVYLLAGKEQFARQSKRMIAAYFSENTVKKITKFFHLVDDTFSSFFRGQFLEACILGLMFFVGMNLFRFPYAALISVLVTITALIPIFGAFIACIIGTFLMIVQNPMQGVWFLVFFLAMQQIEGNFIYPHVMSTRVGLPSIWILVAVTLGGSMFGIVGMLLFIPIMSVVYTLLRQDVDQKLKRKQQILKNDLSSESERDTIC
ncbi:MAG: AI-2E family transporter [Anaerovorax sp.]